jgi:exo-1,4-beta-D-glucosaminidase
VTLKNPGKSIAFFMRMQITGRGDEEALPVLWEDNYVSILPGESRTISATYHVRDLGGSPPRLVVTGWNVRRVTAH